MIKNNFNIAIVGLGNIGLSFYKYLLKNKKSIIQKNDVSYNVKYVSAKNLKKKKEHKNTKK